MNLMKYCAFINVGKLLVSTHIFIAILLLLKVYYYCRYMIYLYLLLFLGGELYDLFR